MLSKKILAFWIPRDMFRNYPSYQQLKHKGIFIIHFGELYCLILVEMHKQQESHRSLLVLWYPWLHNLTQWVEPASTLQSDVFSSFPITQFTNSKNSTATKLIKAALIGDWNGGKFYKIMVALVIMLNSPPNQTWS